MGEFNSDDHYIYYCCQEYLIRNGVALILKKKKIINLFFLSAVPKMNRMILVHFKANHSTSQ